MATIGLEKWIKRLEGDQTIVFSRLVSELNELTSSDQASANQLAEAILKDASLTTQVVRVANAVQYNPSGSPVTTVSRAILKIGFNTVKSLCVSIKLMETVLKDSPSKVLTALMARTLHSASQSRNLCHKLNAQRREEVFVATLMVHLGELLVLGSGEPEALQLEEAISPHALDEEKDRIAEKIIGVSFSRLSKALIKHWGMGGLISEVLTPSSQLSDQAEAVSLGDEIGKLSLYGWDTPEFKSLAIRLAKYTGWEMAELRSSIISTADDAAELASYYGGKIFQGLIPTSKNGSVQTAHSNKPVHQPNPELQLKILQDLSSMMMQDIDINTIFQAVLEGIYRGVGMERAVLAFFDPRHEFVLAKYILGRDTDHWRQRFKFSYVKSHTGFLHLIFEKGDPVWIGDPENDELARLMTPEYRGVTGQPCFFMAPLKVKKKNIGLIYSDMGVSGRELTPEYFNGFSHFSLQASMALLKLGQK